MENVSPEAAYLTKPNIIHQSHTFARDLTAAGLAAAATSHITKADLEATAQEVRGRTRLDEITQAGFTHTGGTIKKGF